MRRLKNTSRKPDKWPYGSTADVWKPGEKRSPDRINLSAKQVVLLLAGTCILSTVLGRVLYAPCDDAYIFYVYVKNLLAGNGLTYNGSVEWGFTSILWVGLLSLTGILGIPVHVGGEILSAISGWFGIVATYVLARSFRLNRLQALIPAMLLAVTGDFAFYSAVGLELPLFVGLIAFAAAMVISGRYTTISDVIALALIMAVMILTRPEGVLICALLISLTIVKSKSRRSAIVCSTLAACLVAPFFIASRLYFGEWLPNTFYVKSNAGLANLLHGVRYIWWSIPRYWSVVVLGASIVIWAIVKRRTLTQIDSWAMLTIAALWLAYVTLQGGDNMVGGRVLIPILPLVYVAFMKLAPKLPDKIAGALAVLICLLLLASYPLDRRAAEHRAGWRTAFTVRYRAGTYLRDNFPTTTVVALNPAGIIPYYSELTTIDMLGLNDRYIAHNGKRDYQRPYGHQAGDGEYVLARKPDVILFGGGLSEDPGGSISDREIWNSPEFHELYAPVDWEGIGTAYVRRSSSQ